MTLPVLRTQAAKAGHLPHSRGPICLSPTYYDDCT